MYLRPRVGIAILTSSRAFTQLLVDNQFAALGLTLLGTLASMSSIIGHVHHHGVHTRTKNNPEATMDECSSTRNEDIGVKIDRDTSALVVDKPSTMGLKSRNELLSEEIKKRLKRRHVIDEIFGSLV